MRTSNSVSLIERIISAASYLTAGGAGFIWLIITALLKKRPTTFLLYHIFQSIFISFAYILLIKICGIFYDTILAKIPLINTIPYLINMPLPLLFNLSLIQAITSGTVLYLAITSFLGLYSYLPYVSNIINTNIGRRY